jgi:chemosensory pili system protein ChpA (sensor histidine kinase/response regulator)
MNSQDKPLEPSNNEDLQADNLWEPSNEIDSLKSSHDKFSDLWTKNKLELSENSSDNQPGIDDFDLELLDFDLRNPPESVKPRKKTLTSQNPEDKANSSNHEANKLDSHSKLFDELDLESGNLELELETNSDSLESEEFDELDLESGNLELELETNSDSLESEKFDELDLESGNLELELETNSDSLELELFDNLDLESAIQQNQSKSSSWENLEIDGELELEYDFSAMDGEELEELEETAFFPVMEKSPALEPLTEESLLDNDLESLDNLLESDNEPLELDSTADLTDLEEALDSPSQLSDLDMLLEEEEPVAPPKISQPPARPKTPAVRKPNAEVESAKAQVFDQTMRVSVKKLDELNNLIGELVVKRNRLEEDQDRLRRFLDNLLGHVQSLGEAGAKMHDMYERSLLEGALIASRQSRAASGSKMRSNTFVDVEQSPQEEGLDALEMDRFTGFHLLSQEIIELIVRVREAASDIQFVVDESDKVAQTLRQVTGQLQDGINSSRMVQFGQTADRLPRAIRDISRKQKKQANLHVEGKEVLIDKMIVEHLYNPMTHLVNNAISHGIEKPEERRKLGKAEAGNIYVRAFIQGNQTVITVSDDGAGINSEIVKKKAVEKNLITWAAAQNLSQHEVYELLFHPGFSTKDQADDFAGRGVGMDVVMTDLKKIRGTISIESELGKGTTFTIRLPLVLSICKALTCVDNNRQIAFPIDGVEDTKEYLPIDIQTNANGVRTISWQNTSLPLRPLSSLLSYNRQIGRGVIYSGNSKEDDDMVSVVILRSVDHLLAVEVDEVLTEQEIVIKQIDGPIPKPPGIAGTTVLGDGMIMPIGDVLELIEIAQGKRTIEVGFNIVGKELEQKRREAENVQHEPTVLVVDDSITVRELLSLSFNKLGYRVEQARDGQEAWDKLRNGLPCDMIFCDIEMPRMNGLELLSNLQQQDNLKLIPVAMLTSRGAEKHRKIASDLGAKAYLTKPYTEKDLMDVAQHLIEINRANKEAEFATVKTQKLERTTKNHSDAEKSDAPLVLIIDDSVTVRELLSMTFKKAGYRVEQARDGQEAWEKLKDGLDCDLAFCDIEMPRMNGLELLSQLQADEQLSSLPIAMLTSRGAQKMRNIAAKRGAKGYFVKPYVEEALLDAAQRMMTGEVLIEQVDLDSAGE